MKRTVRILEAFALAVYGTLAFAACPPTANCALSDAVEQTGPSWAFGAADAMDSIIAAGNLTGDMAVNIAALQTSQQLSAAAAKMVPVIVGQSGQQANLTLDDLSSLVVMRMDASRGQRANGEAHDQTLWVRPFGTRAEQQRDGQYPQYDVDSNGVAVGYDIDVGRWNIGAAYALSKPTVRTQSSLIDQGMDIDSSLVGLYGYWVGDGDVYLTSRSWLAVTPTIRSGASCLPASIAPRSANTTPRMVA
jgi:outer membrane autotransporter protein